MRALVLVMLAACGTTAPSGPASVAQLDCKRLGPNGTGFMFDSQYDVALGPERAHVVALAPGR